MCVQAHSVGAWIHVNPVIDRIKAQHGDFPASTRMPREALRTACRDARTGEQVWTSVRRVCGDQERGFDDESESILAQGCRGKDQGKNIGDEGTSAGGLGEPLQVSLERP